MSAKPKIVRSLEVLAYLFVIAGSLFFMGEHLFTNPSQAALDIPTIEVGEKHKALGNLVNASHEKALIMAISPDCPFCEKSMPFFNDLLLSRSEKGAPLTIVAATGKHIPLEEEQKSLDQHKVKPDKLVQLDMQRLKISGVPTFLLVDASGKVEAVWSGYPSPEEQKKMKKALL